MSRYLVLLPAPEAEWAALPPEEHDKGMRAHQRFHRELAEGGHTVVATSPLTPSAQAVSMRPDGQGGTTVTDGPFSETVEQIAGFYLVDTDDSDGFLACCRQLASTGDLLEIRRLVEGDHEHDQPAGQGDPVSPRRRYAILLPGDEDAWAAASAQERAEAYAAHERFSTALTERGHRIIGGVELAHSRAARTVRPRADGGTLVTEGPFAELAEQLTGLYLVESADLDDLVGVCQGLAGAGENIEIRPYHDGEDS